MCENRLRRLSLSVHLLLLIFLNGGLAYPTDEVTPEELKASLGYSLNNLDPAFQDEEPNFGGQKGCFHFYIARNMSTLLSDATKMLQQSHSRREQEWILTFIYRIKALAEHLRTHPESQNYDCISSENEAPKKGYPLEDRLRTPQQELYFEDDFLPGHVQKRSHMSGSASHSSDDTHIKAQQPSNQQLSSPSLQEAFNDSNHMIQNIADQEEKSSSFQKSDPDNSHQEKKSSIDSVSLNERSIVNHDSKDKKADNLAYRATHPGAWREESMPRLPEEESEASSSDPLKEESDVQIEEENPPLSISDAIPLQNSKIRHENVKYEENHGRPSEEINQDRPFPPPGYHENFIFSSPPDCGSNRACEEALRRQVLTGSPDEDDRSEYLITEVYETSDIDDLYKERMIRDKIKSALLEEMASKMKALKIAGGTEQDLLDLWKSADVDMDAALYINILDYLEAEENGAATGDVNANDKNTPGQQTVAPSLGETKNIKTPVNKESGSTKPYEPEAENDVLAKQLFDVRYETNPKITSSHKDDYLITSTPFPY